MSLLSGVAAWAAETARHPKYAQPAVEDAVRDVYQPAPFESEKIDGLLGERMKVNLEARLLKLDTAPLLEGFQNRPGKQDWIGEHVGKFLHAAGNAYRYTHNEALKARIEQIVKDLLATQNDDGYLGTYLNVKKWGSWDVWCHKYVLIGLLTHYQITGDEKSLAACKRIGDLLIKTFGTGEGQRDLMASGTHVGMAPGSVLEPMCMLYRYTGEPRYLEFCRYIVKAYDQSPRGPKLIKSLTEHGNVRRTANNKAYEMLSCLVGVADLYRLTGDKALLTPCEKAWQDIVDHRLYVSGTSSWKEHFREDEDLLGSGDVGEMCVTVTWLQLNWHLLRLTGDPKYAAELERSIYNALLAAQHPDTGGICYFAPLVGGKGYNAVSQGVKGVNCCISSGQRGLSLLPEFVWGLSNGNPVIWQYTAGSITLPMGDIGAIAIMTQTRYPLDGTIAVTVVQETACKYPLLLRVPAWTTSFVANVGGQSLKGKPGELLRIEREWKSGDKVAIDVNLAVRVLRGGKSYPGCIAIQRGPQVLALDSALDQTDADTLQVADVKEVKLTDAKEKLPAGWHGQQAYECQIGGKTILLVPFADAGQTGGKYRVWLGPLPPPTATPPKK